MISIHQSQFLPWLPFFYKALKGDIFVVLDDVQFQKNGVQNRNMIKAPQGAQWITIPVRVSLGDPIHQVPIVNPRRIYEKILKTIEGNYKKAPFFAEVYQMLEEVFQQEITTLHEFNNRLLQGILSWMPKRLRIVHSSELATTKKKDELVFEIIERFGEKQYLSGPGALNYMDLKQFKKRGMEVYVAQFEYREYPQLWNARVGFVKDLSIIDLLFNDKPNAFQYIMRNGTTERVV